MDLREIGCLMKIAGLTFLRWRFSWNAGMLSHY